MEYEKISNTLYKFSLTIGAFSVNVVASIGADGILLVDTGWAQTAEEIDRQLKELSEGIVKLIILTHQHGDHIGGRGALGEMATLIAHKNTKDALAGKYYGLAALPGQELPTITLENELSLRFNGEEIRIIPASGHTNSDMAVYFVDAGVVCLGDLVLSDMFPPLDLARGGDAERYGESLGRLAETFPAEVKFITGHGRDYTPEDLRAHHQMALGTMDLIKQGIAAGKNAQEMVAEEILKDWAKWDTPQVSAEAWITQAYECLSGQRKKPIAETLSYTIMEKGVEAAITQYERLKNERPDAYNFGENELNMLGYQLLWREMNAAAIEVLKLNIRAYPHSANTYDSLGEAYMAGGFDDLAIESFEKAIALDPNMSSAVEAVKKLRGG